jgi:hypothetical protein
MNIIKIQNQLKGVPDDALVGYVQNPTGQVPTYLALSELQRRKEMRASYQANKPEEKTVAEDLVQEAQPQQPQMPQGGVAQLPQAQPMMQAMQPPPEMPMQQMAQGGLAELDTGDMYDENNYANGGIVAFAKGGTPDEYGVTMPIVPTMDDMYMQTQAAQQAFGVDPDFYKKTLEESKTERLKELADAKNMDQAQLLLSMGSAFAGTPTFGKALSVAGERAVPIIGAMGKNQREINSLYKMADRKSLEAQYAQSRGDAAGAQKAINDKEGLLLQAQLKEAEIKKDINVAGIHADAAKAGKLAGLQNEARDNAMNEMKSAYPTGVNDTHFGGDANKVTRYNAELEQRYQNNLAILYKNNNIDNPNPAVKPASNVSTTDKTNTKVAAPTSKPKPTQDDMKYVLDNLNNPAVAAKYEETFGVKAPRSMADLIPR